MRESALRQGGFEVISVGSAIEARYEIEMGRCGVFLTCYRTSLPIYKDLTKLFRKSCPNGQILVVTRNSDEAFAVEDTDILVPESREPEYIVELLRAGNQQNKAS